MSYIVMATDECGDEWRPPYPAFVTEEQAYSTLSLAREEYPECRSIWVEELHDKAYFQKQRQQNEYWEDEYDY